MTYDDLVALPLADLPAALAALTDKARKALAAEVKARAFRYDRDDPSRHVLIALGCLAGAKQVARALDFHRLRAGDEDLAIRIVRDRQPHWLGALPEALSAQVTADGWRLVRALVREGLVDRPATPWYAVGLVRGLDPERWTQPRPVADLLHADPGLLADEVWTMLATEGAGSELANADGWIERPGEWRTAPEPRTDYTWRHTLVALAADGTLDRDRLLDTALAAFLRDWPPIELPWFALLHDALAPSGEELAARQGTYARLLAAAYGPAVKLAQQAFGRLLADGRLDAEVLLGATPAVLQRPDKGTVVAHLKLLAAVAKARPDLATAVQDAARVALDHERADVRERAARLVPGEVAVVVAEPLDDVPLDDVPVARPAPVPVVPVADAAELAELFARLLEEADDPVEVERALEGVARLARARPAHGADALVRRAGARRGELDRTGWSSEEIRACLAELVLVWLGGAKPGPGYAGRPHWSGRTTEDRTLGAVVAHRAHEVGVAVAAGGARLLSLPATSDGALPGTELGRRLRGSGRLAAPLPIDAAVAALRVPPAEYAAVDAPGAHRTGRVVRGAIATLAAYAPAWERADFEVRPPHARDPWPAVTWRDRSAAGGDGVLGWVLDRRDPAATVEADAGDGEYVGRYEQVVALWPLLLPHHPELLASHAHARLARGLRANRSASGVLLDALARQPGPAGPVTCSALALGLALDNATERTRAVDAVVDLAGAGLLDGGELGRQAAPALRAGTVVGQRLAGSLADAARAGRAASRTVLDVLVALLPVLPGRRDAHAFVDVLARVAVANGRTVALPEEFATLARGRSSSVLAAACRRVPA